MSSLGRFVFILHPSARECKPPHGFCVKIHHSPLLETDIRKIDFSKLKKVDALVAGFPCQPFSVCGKKQGFSDARGNLFFEIMRATDALQPSIIFLENVANLTEHDNGRTFNVIHNELVSREYVIRYMIADACDYGIIKRLYLSPNEYPCRQTKVKYRIPTQQNKPAVDFFHSGLFVVRTESESGQIARFFSFRR